MYVNQAMTLNIQDKNNPFIVSYWKYLDDIAFYSGAQKSIPEEKLNNTTHS